MKVLDIVNYLDNRFPIENASDFNSLANFLDSILDKEDGRR